MKAATLASLSLAAGMTALAGLASWASTSDAVLAGLPPASRSIAIATGTGLVLAAALIPCGILLDRRIGALVRRIERAASGGPSRSGRESAGTGQIMGAVQRAVHRLQQRDQALRHRLRGLEIRHHVCEAERRRLETVLHSLGDAVLVTDAFDEIEMANEAAARVLDFELAAAIHQPIDRVIGDDHLRQLIGDVRDTANFGRPLRVEHELRTGAGAPAAPRVFEIALQCVANHRREIGGVVTILHDLTRERELSQMKTDFVSKASHELRTPLSSIRAYVEMLVDGEAADEASRREFYQIIQNETHRLGRLIDNMLNISRIEAGIVQVDRRPVDIKAICERAVATLEPQAREKRITFRRRLAAGDLRIEGDEDMLYQVVLNLASNAVKYTPAGGLVTVSVHADELARSMLVSVSDTGLGVPPDAVPRLFDKFYRVELYEHIAKGTGLGLSLCKHIVESVHDGRIGVDSELGLGSRFWFTIPLRHVGARAAA